MRHRVRTLAWALAAAVTAAQAPRAHAAVTYELLPTVSAGVTTNAQPTGSNARDELALMSTLALMQHRGLRDDSSIGYRLVLSHYFQGHGTDTASNELLALTGLNLSPGVDLRLSGSGVLSRNSQIGVLGLVTPQAAAGGSSTFLSTSAGEELIWQVQPRWRCAQSLQAGRVDYPFADLIPTRRSITTFTAGLRTDYQWPVDSLFLDLRGSEFLAGAAPAGGGFPAVEAVADLFATAALGWRHEMTQLLSLELEGGAAYFSNGPGTDVYQPAGQASLAYRRLAWYATVEASQRPEVNMLVGLATFNDQVFARIELPVSTSELVVLSGFGGLIYARTANTQGALLRAYDQQSVGVRLSAQLGVHPLAISAEYTFMNQDGGPGIITPVPDLRRHMVMVHLTSALAFGPSTPPLAEAGRLMLPQR